MAHASIIVLLVGIVWVGSPYDGFAEEQKPVRHAPHKLGVVHFNNPKLLSDLVKSGDTEYTVSTMEEKANPSQIGGIVINDEATVLGSKLRLLANNEIGVTTMQVSCKRVDEVVSNTKASLEA